MQSIFESGINQMQATVHHVASKIDQTTHQIDGLKTDQEEMSLLMNKKLVEDEITWKESKKFNDLDGVTKCWVEVLEILDSKSLDWYENAYQWVLEMQDDIYFLRLIS